LQKPTPERVRALLEHLGLKARESDTEQLWPLIETYAAALEKLHSLDLSGEEVAPTFDPRWVRERRPG
jgi:hypothetical protein